MRLLVVSVSALCAACFAATCAVAADQWGQAQDQLPPYNSHVDRRHGSDRAYPDRGAIVRDLPKGAAVVNYAGISYRFAGGVWYESLGPAYMVVAPPIGIIVPQLPAFVTSFEVAGESYLYANDVFYRPQPDLGGYEVVNDPQDTATSGGSAASAGTPSNMNSPAPLPIATPQPDAAPQAIPASPPEASSATDAQAPVQAKSMAVPAPTSGSDSSPVPALSNPTRVVISPRNGQSADQEATDRYECYQFAVAQSGFDPLASASGVSAAAQARSNYSRAQAACLDGRGYAVE